MSATALWLYQSQRTVLGRLAVGPAIVIVSLATRVVRNLLAGNWNILAIWAVHLPLVAMLLWALDRYTELSAWHYCFGIAYPALGLAMLRSLYEHRPGALPAHRTVINEAAAPWRLLYLNNNFHVVHHAYPEAAWYKIPTIYRAERASWQTNNGGFVLPGYLHLLRHFAWAPIDSPVLTAPATAPQRATPAARSSAKS
jgi:fatty acid desaturase